jgi:replicative DNA helicase
VLTPGDDQVASDAEEHLVSCLLLKPDAILRVGRLELEDFYNPRHRVAFESIRLLHDRGEPVDLMTLEAQINSTGMLEAVGGLAGLAKYMLLVPTADAIGHYAAIIRDRSFSRRLRVAADSTLQRIEVGASWRDALASLRGALEELEDNAQPEAATLADVARTEVDAIRAGVAEVVGLSTGLGIERVCPTGIPLDKVTTVFGETGNFKTTLVSNLAWNIAAAGHGVLSISWEDSNQLAAQRMLARQSGVSYGRIAARTLGAEERAAIDLKAGDVAARIIMADNVEPTIEAVVRLARYYKRTKGVAAVVVDYLQLLDGAGSQKQILDDAVQTAQRSAAQDKIAYIFVSQVKAEVTNRKAEDGGPRPTLDDCLGSSAMRIGTKLGLGVFRPWKYCRVPSAKGAYAEYHALAAGWPEGKEQFLRDIYPRVLEVWVSKNVMGEAPVCIPCLVDLPTGRIEPFNVGAP